MATMAISSMELSIKSNVKPEAASCSTNYLCSSELRQQSPTDMKAIA